MFVLECDLCRRKGSFEPVVTEVGESRHGTAGHTVTEVHSQLTAVVQIAVAVEHSCVNRGSVLGFGLHRDVGTAVDGTLGSTVENLPVQKPSVAPKTDGAGADSSEREGNIVGFPSFVGSANHSCYRLSGFFIPL